MKRVVAILDTMWDWRQATSSVVGYKSKAPKFFRINPYNFSGKRLYKLVGRSPSLLVTNACSELASSARQHGSPDPDWLNENLKLLDRGVGIDVLLVCGRTAVKTYNGSGFVPRKAVVIEMPHPAARKVWTKEFEGAMATRIQKELK